MNNKFRLYIDSVAQVLKLGAKISWTTKLDGANRFFCLSDEEITSDYIPSANFNDLDDHPIGIRYKEDWKWLADNYINSRTYFNISNLVYKDRIQVVGKDYGYRYSIPESFRYNRRINKLYRDGKWTRLREIADKCNEFGIEVTIVSKGN